MKNVYIAATVLFSVLMIGFGFLFWTLFEGINDLQELKRETISENTEVLASELGVSSSTIIYEEKENVYYTEEGAYKATFDKGNLKKLVEIKVEN